MARIVFRAFGPILEIVSLLNQAGVGMLLARLKEPACPIGIIGLIVVAEDQFDILPRQIPRGRQNP